MFGRINKQHLRLPEILHDQLYLSGREDARRWGNSSGEQCLVEWTAADDPSVHDPPGMFLPALRSIKETQLCFAVTSDSETLCLFCLYHLCEVCIYSLKILIFSEMSNNKE